MHAYPESLLNLLHALCRCERRVGGLQRENVLEDLSRKLVAPLGAASTYDGARGVRSGSRGMDGRDAL